MWWQSEIWVIFWGVIIFHLYVFHVFHLYFIPLVFSLPFSKLKTFMWDTEWKIFRYRIINFWHPISHKVFSNSLHTSAQWSWGIEVCYCFSKDLFFPELFFPIYSGFSRSLMGIITCQVMSHSLLEWNHVSEWASYVKTDTEPTLGLCYGQQGSKLAVVRWPEATK